MSAEVQGSHVRSGALAVLSTSCLMAAVVSYLIINGHGGVVQDHLLQTASKFEALRKARLEKLDQVSNDHDSIDDNDDDIHFGAATLRKGYPSPLSEETGYRIRPSKYGPADGYGQVYGYPWRPLGQFKDSKTQNNGVPVPDDQGPDYRGNPGDPEDFFDSAPSQFGDGTHCHPGYYGDGRTCAQCKVCSPHATTGNPCLLGSTADDSTCTCNAGYYGDGLTCTACKTCSSHATLSNACPAGSASDTSTCTCNGGYTGDGVTCTAIPPPAYCRGFKLKSYTTLSGSGTFGTGELHYRCDIWHLTSSSNGISIHYNTFNVESCCDKVSIQNCGEDASCSSPTEEWSGTGCAANDVSINGKHVLVVFTSDYDNAACGCQGSGGVDDRCNGFQAQFNSI